MKSIYAPFKPDGNPYVEIVQRSLHMYGIETVQLRTAFKIGGAKEIRVANTGSSMTAAIRRSTGPSCATCAGRRMRS